MLLPFRLLSSFFKVKFEYLVHDAFGFAEMIITCLHRGYVGKLLVAKRHVDHLLQQRKAVPSICFLCRTDGFVRVFIDDLVVFG